MKTKCNKCVFAITDGKQQVGCELGRVSRYIERGKATLNEDNFYDIDGLCIACRDEKSASVYKNPKEEILKEISPRISTIIDCTNGFNEEKMSKLSKLGLNQIILFFHKDKISKHHKTMCDLVEGTETQFKITNFLDRDPKTHDNFQSLKGNYVLVGEDFTKEDIQHFRDLIVKDVKSIVLYFKDKKNFIVSSLIYMYVSQDIDAILEVVDKEENKWQK